MTMSSKSSKSSNSGKTCCILVGSAGCGKSTLVENMSSDGIIRSSNSENSTTKAISVTKHKTDGNLLLMDTIGCEDTDNVMSDEEILKEITDKLAKSGAPKIKVIWCAKPEDRKIPKLQKQAEFINSLINGNWGAVQVIVKKGTGEEDSNGLRGAVKLYTDKKLPIYDLHCLDRIPNIKKNKMYKYAIKGNLDERCEDGFLYSKEISSVISGKIGKLTSAKAKLKKEFYHKKSGVLVEKKKHNGYIIESWPWRHSGDIEEYTSSSRMECPRGHPESDIEYCVYKHGSWVSNWECDYCGKDIKVGHNFYHCFGCCDRGKRRGHSSIVKKCSGMFCTSCGKTTCDTKSERFTCCWGGRYSTGCKGTEKFSVCGHTKGTDLCTVEYKYWNCCGIKENEKLNKVCGKWKWVPENYS